ncbi:penicillin acylase family protein [Chloroflexi bacterium TSY]|nr:penicillin acylase family protein [Chloroflexi bacterium TSY]
MSTTLFVLVLLILILLIALGGGFFVLVYWRLIQRPVPKLDDEFSLDILDASVEVLHDKHGIPHIYADSRADLFRAQGYIHARDRLWQMEQSRRIARGTLAEIFGEPALEADRFSRVVGFWRAARLELEHLDAETRQILDWYAEGVNAYIEKDAGRLAAEFNLLRCRPEPWSALDTVGYSKIMSWSLCVNWESELTRMRLALQMDPILASELEGDYPKENPAILEALSQEESDRLLSTAGLLLGQYESIRSWLGEQGVLFGSGQGSNSWVLSPKASLTGQPLLANDSHLTISMPGAFYENHLICPDYEVSGASFPGAPGVVIGHNADIAWGITNGFADVQDLYLERANPDDDTQFEYMGEWESAQIIEETIQVRKQAPHIERVIVTRHGPIISNLIQALDTEATGPSAALHTIPLALRWSGHEAGHSIRAILGINQASSWDEFDHALADWGAAPQNFVYADVNGYIGYVMGGNIPKRERNVGLLPAPGWTGEHEWMEMIPHDELPRITNPESGIIVTANNKMVGDDYPHFLGMEYYPGWRARRLEELLQTKSRYTQTDMETMQIDNMSKFAQSLTPWFTVLTAKNTFETIALTELRNWNHRMDVESRAPTVFHYMLWELLSMTFGNKVGKIFPSYLGIATNPLFGITGFHFRAQTRLLELIENHERSSWYIDSATGQERTRDELLQEAFSRAVSKLCEDVGESPVRWQWGRHHQLRYVHPLGSVRMLKTFFNRGPFPVDGDGTTPLQTRHATQMPLELVQVVPVYRQVYEVGEWDRAQSVTISGQSGHPLSPQYDDQISLWREGVYHAMPWSRQAVENLAVHRTIMHVGNK